MVPKKTYDPVGNPASHTSTRLGSSTQAETQCYQYDGLDRLTTAWTATDNCAATPSASSHATVGDGLGSASAYWTTWSYDDVLGNMTSQVQHSLSGGADTTTTDSYFGTGPHALTGAAASGGSSSVSSFGYDAAGT